MDRRLASCRGLLGAVVVWGTASACSMAAAPGVRADRPRNVLLILADDQRWDTIGALGNPEVRTPNLDRLVGRGFRFNNAYCMGSMIGAVCLPSRTMLITGRSLWRIPANPRAAVAPPGVPILPALLNDAGYATFHSGKAGNACTFANAAFATNISTQGRTADSATEHADNAIAFLNGHDVRKPFFLYLAPPVPHDPRLAPAEFSRLYDPAKLSLSRNFLPEHPFDNGELLVRDELLAPHPRTPDAMRRALADYYATVSHLDHEVGRVLEALRARGLEEETVVIYTSDQGLAVGGRHGLMGKQNLYEHVKPPLILAGPGIPHGQSDALVYLFDLFPTICDLAAIPTPDVAEGRSLLPVVRGDQPRLRDRLFGAYRDCQRMVRDERWKLIKYNAAGGKHTQLFDLRDDPDELTNLADDPRSAPQLARLESALAEARKEFGDPIDFDSPNPRRSQAGPTRTPSEAAAAPGGPGKQEE
jgi:arylsulfatase A-like enzyme